MKSKRESPYYVYIVRGNKGTLYTGHTNDVEKRVKAHNGGKGAKYLRGRLPVELMYVKKCKSGKCARVEEYRIKQLRRDQKIALIMKNGDVPNM